MMFAPSHYTTEIFPAIVADGFESGSEKKGDKRIQTQLNAVGATE
jgi:hypothetical protein